MRGFTVARGPQLIQQPGSLDGVQAAQLARGKLIGSSRQMPGRSSRYWLSSTF